MTMPLSPKERLTLGQQRRKQMRRAEHGVWKAKARREDPLKLMEKSMHGRVPALAALKYERMEASPFGYFRGAVPVMAYDFSLAANTGILTQLCGDAHVRNLGAYAGSDGRLLFDINDFDETIAGPFEWDVKRMATSLVLAGREAGANDGNCRRGCGGFPGSISTRLWRHLRACQCWTWRDSRCIVYGVFRRWSEFSKWRSARPRQIL